MTANSSVQRLSAEEISKAEQYLLSTRDEVKQAAGGLSAAQYRFKPSAEQWSIGEILEHLVIVEERLQGRIRDMSDGASAEEGRDNVAIDESIVRDVPKRTQRFSAPPLISPTGQCEPGEWLKRFMEARAETIRLLKMTPYLRERVFPHPVAGTWDGYQWVLGVAAHSARHADQMRELKAHTEFPQDGESG